jgi:hypothetical protein
MIVVDRSICFTKYLLFTNISFILSSWKSLAEAMVSVQW